MYAYKSKESKPTIAHQKTNLTQKTKAINLNPAMYHNTAIIQKKEILSPIIQFAPTDAQTLNHIYYGFPMDANTVPPANIPPKGLHAYSDVGGQVKTFGGNALPTIRNITFTNTAVPTGRVGGLPAGITALGYIGKLNKVHILHWKRSGSKTKFSTMMPINLSQTETKNAFLHAKSEFNRSSIDTPQFTIGGTTYDFDHIDDTIFPISNEPIPEDFTFKKLFSGQLCRLALDYLDLDAGKSESKPTLKQLYDLLDSINSQLILTKLQEKRVYHLF